MTEELKSKIVWQEDKDFGKVCTLTESALNGIINEATKELQEENKRLFESCEGATMLYKDLTEAKEIIRELVKYEMQGAGSVYWKDKAEAFLKG